MKSLTKFINEELIMELSSATAKSAYSKEYAKNGFETSRARMFKKYAHDAIDREMEDDKHTQTMLNNTIKQFNEKFGKIISRLKLLGGELGEISSNFKDNTMENNNVILYDGNDKRFGVDCFFSTKYRNKTIVGMLRYFTLAELYIMSLNDHDTLDNAFFSLDGNTIGDGACMSDSDAKTVEAFVNKILHVNYDYMDYLTNKDYKD